MKKSIYTLFIVFFCGTFIANAQSFRFKNYDTNIGLPQNFVYCVEQGLDGYLWIGTGEGLVRYDGHKFQTFLVADSLAEDNIMSLFVASNGVVWIGHNTGNLSYYHNNKFSPVFITDANSTIRHICQDKAENIWAVDQNSGFIRIDKNLNVTTFFDQEKLGYNKRYYSIYPISQNQILLGTDDGLMKIDIGNNNEIISAIEIDEIPYSLITTIVPKKGVNGEYWIGTEDDGFFRYIVESSKATQIIDNRLCLAFNIERENIQDIVEENDGHLLLATWGRGVIKLFFDPIKQDFYDTFTFSTINGLAENYIKKILCDREGNYWFATYGGGLSVLIDESMVFYNLDNIGKDRKAYSVYKSEKSFYIGLDDGFLKADPFCYTDFEFYNKEMGIPEDEIRGFYQSEDGILWVATSNNGLYYQKSGERNFKQYHYSNKISENKIRDIKGYKNTIYLATVGGYFEINFDTNQITHLTTEKNLPHNNINFVYRDSKGNIWLGPKNSGICRIKNDSIEVHKISQIPIDVYGIAEDIDGNFWLATHGKGILHYTADSLGVITVAEGLAKNFCYDIVRDETNQLWVLHFPGLSCINLDDYKIRTFGYEENFGADFYQVFVDKELSLWFASSQGVINYFPKKDIENLVPPKLNFTKIRISGKEYDLNTEVIKLKYPSWKEKYNIRFDFIGISFKNPKGVTYQYQLEKEGNTPKEWVDLPTTWWEQKYLPDGNWILRIRSFNSDGIYNSDPLTIRIQIAPPIWKKGWFYLVLISVLVYLVYLIIYYRERKLKAQKELLQREVDNQTVILRQQKAEIERKNRDITDSINYAKRIQTSILPSNSILESRFKESFIFFAPRDIVSGDFYWFYEISGKFLCCCADCTGHGVPGAFMSMIGSTLLNDIVKRQDVNTPSDILNRLDFEIKILLQRNTLDYSQDGMDISIVEIDLDTNKIRIASAKRPIYMFLNNELTIYKGTRRSIADSIPEDEAPEFVNIEYDGAINDTIYLFSDGFGDQFGGEYGKKFMTPSIKIMLEEIQSKTMAEQYNIIKSTFKNWKSDYEQVDDVIFIGIKL